MVIPVLCADMVIPGLPDDMALICLIRLPKFAQQRLRRVSKCWNRVFSSREFHALRLKHKVIDEWLLFVISRSSAGLSDASASLLVYDFNSRSRHRVDVPVEADSQLNFMGVGCASSDSRFFVLGGSSLSSDGLSCYSHPDVLVFDAARNTWSRAASMRHGRAYFASGCIDGTLYVAGGEDQLQTTEAYDIQSGNWRQAASMPFGFETIESFAVFKSKLYVKGMAGFERKVLVFDPRRDPAWDCSKGVEKGIRKGELVATKENLYLINQSGYVGRFEEESDEWIQAGTISRCFVPFSRSNAGSALCFPSNEVFFIESTTEADLADLKSSRHLAQALLRAFWLCPGAVVNV